MSKRKFSATSRAAYDTLTPEKLGDTYKKIIAALSTLGEATSEKIAAKMKCKPDSVWKRLKELSDRGLLYKPGNKQPLKSGCMGFTWSLTEKGRQIVESSQELLPGKPIQDISRDMNNKKPATQTSLF